MISRMHRNQASELQDKKAAAQAEKDNLAAQLEKIVDDMDKTKSDIEKKQEGSLQRQMNSSLLRLMRITSITA